MFIIILEAKYVFLFQHLEKYLNHQEKSKLYLTNKINKAK